MQFEKLCDFGMENVQELFPPFFCCVLGELLGVVEYLQQQTGEVSTGYKSAIQELETADVCIAEDEGYVEPVDFEDLTLTAWDVEEPPCVLPSTSCAVPSEDPHLFHSTPSTASSEDPCVTPVQ